MTPRKFFYILLGALALILVAGGYAYYYATTSLQEGTIKVSQRLGDQQLANERLAQLDDLKQQYQRLQPLLPTINSALPAQKDQTRLALQLRNIASKSGMSLDGLTFPASTAPGPVSQTVKVGDVLAIPVTFQLIGTYEQLQQFLQLQENLDRYTSVTSLTISSDRSGLSFNISLTAYLKP